MKIDKQTRLEINSSNDNYVNNKSDASEKVTQTKPPTINTKERDTRSREILGHAPDGNMQSLQPALPKIDDLYFKAMEALGNQNTDGTFSDEDAKAIEEYIVYGNMVTAPQYAIARETYKEELPQITAAQRQRWDSVCQRVNPVVLESIRKIPPLRSITQNEVADALKREPSFSLISEGKEFRLFVKNLTDVINTKVGDMQPTDKGMALIFKFPATYGEVGHIALGSLWRDETGKIQLSINHQESVEPTKASGNVYTGRIYNTFDTALTYPTKIAPVVEEMKLFGPPSVNVYPVPYPEVLPEYTEAFSDHVDHERTYSPVPVSDWNPAQTTTVEKNMHTETCFNTTYKSMARLYGLRPAYAPTLPTVFDRMKGFAGVPPAAFKEIKIKGKSYSLDQISSDKNLVVPGFIFLGSRWIDESVSDVAGKRKGKPAELFLEPRQEGFSLHLQAAMFKFTSEVSTLRDIALDGKPVIKGKIYTADEAARMVYKGKEKSKNIKYITTDMPNTGAKL